MTQFPPLASRLSHHRKPRQIFCSAAIVLGGSFKASNEWMGIAHNTVFTRSSLPLLGSEAPLHVGSLLASCSTRYRNCATVDFWMLRRRPNYLHGNVPIEHPNSLSVNITWSSVHLIGLAELFWWFTRRPEAMPKSSNMSAQVQSSASLGLMNIMTSSVKIDMR